MHPFPHHYQVNASGPAVIALHAHLRLRAPLEITTSTPSVSTGSAIASPTRTSTFSRSHNSAPIRRSFHGFNVAPWPAPDDDPADPPFSLDVTPIISPRSVDHSEPSNGFARRSVVE
jgi:hypothetical protein